MLLDPPAASEGFQLNVPKFDVAAGDEVQNCYFFAVPGTPGQDVWINHFKLAANAGTHHVNIFRVKTIVGLGGNPGDVVSSKNGVGPCFVSSNWADWPLVVNTQQGGTTVDWTLPDGVGQRFSPASCSWCRSTSSTRPRSRRPTAGAAPRTSTHEDAAGDTRWGRSSPPTRTSASAPATPTRPSRPTARRR